MTRWALRLFTALAVLISLDQATLNAQRPSTRSTPRRIVADTARDSADTVRRVVPRSTRPAPRTTGRTTGRLAQRDNATRLGTGTGLQLGEQCPIPEECGGGGETTYGVDVSPDGDPVSMYSNLTNQSAEFYVQNTGSASATFSLTCSTLGNLTCTQIRNIQGTPITSIVLGAGVGNEVVVIYASGNPGSGSLRLTASNANANDQGSFAVTIVSPPPPGPPTVALRAGNLGGALSDRGLCFTSGGGPAAGISCGDLFVTHGMPTYRTKGRDRSLALHYNSATARGAVLVAGDVYLPPTQSVPSYIRAILEIGGQKDSADFQASSTGIGLQLVLGKRITGLTTGSYPYTLRVRNVYSGSSYETVVTGRTMVVNRSTSQYGRGWGLLGVETLQFTASADTMVWVGGDGSAALYTRYDATRWVAPRADFRDTITYNPTTLQYTRGLKHRVKVVFNSGGRHIYTINRMADTTTFTWGTIAGQQRLTAIRVPPNDAVVRQYQLYYNATTAVLDSIRDPGGRRLRLARTGDQVTTITDPDNQVTTFAYDATHLMMTSRAMANPAGPGGKSTVRWTYGNGVRVTRVVLPHGAAGTDSAVTTITPWDEWGLGALTVPSLNTPALILTTGPSTTIYPPLSSTPLSVMVDSFGSPIWMLRNGQTTTIERGNANFPALVTRIVRPTGNIDSLWYDARGNLTKQKQWSPDAFPTRITTWAYGSANEPDGPTAVTDSTGGIGGTGRTSTYAYDTNGLPQHDYAPNGAHTEYSYLTSGANRGLMQWTKTYGVATWNPVTGTSPLATLQTSFTYDNNGNVRTTTLPNGVVSTMEADSLGRVVNTWDPFQTRAQYQYDLLNRVTHVTQYAGAQTNPFVSNPLQSCDSTAFYCVNDTTTAIVNWQDGFPTTAVTRTFYGPVGVDSLLDPRNVPSGTRYNGSGQAWISVDEAGRSDTTFYRRDGQVDYVKTRDTLTIRHYYDGPGRRIATVHPNRSFPARGQSPATTVLGDSISYTYDSYDRVIQVKSEYRGRGTITRTYYSNGALKTQVTNYGMLDSLSYWYDSTGARLKVAHVTVSGSTTLRDTTFYRYRATTGSLDTMRIQIVTPSAGNLTGIRHIRFLYDTLGRRVSTVYPTGLTVTQAYDALGGLRRLSTGTGCGTTEYLCVDLTQTSVRADGQILQTVLDCGGRDTTRIYSCGNEAVLTTTNRYYRFGWLARQTSGWQRYDTLQYDLSGNIIRRRSYGDGNLGWHRMAYALRSNRLLADTVPWANGVLTYTYTAGGARNTEFDDGEVERTFFYDGLGRPTGLGTLKGLGCTGTPACWTWIEPLNGRGNDHDPDGQMVRTQGGSGGMLAYDGSNVVTALGGASGTIWHFLPGGLDSPLLGWFAGASGNVDKMLYYVTDGSGRQYALGDTTGSWSASTFEDLNSGYGGWDQAGGTRMSASFGADRQGSPNTPQISFFRNRMYDLRSGRWTQEDPIGVAGGINLYQYSGNNPVAFSDPWGLCKKKNDPKCRDQTPQEGSQNVERARTEVARITREGIVYGQDRNDPKQADCSLTVCVALDHPHPDGDPHLNTRMFEDNPNYRRLGPSEHWQAGDVFWQPRNSGPPGSGHIGIATGERDRRGRPTACDMGGSGARCNSAWGPGGWFDGGESMRIYRPQVATQ
jgi:RHS repeat-associated protein